MQSDITKRRGASGKRSLRSSRLNPDRVKPPENLFQLLLQILDRVGRFRQVLIVILIVAGASFAAWSQIPEQGKLSLVNRLIKRDQPLPAGYYPSVEIEDTTLRYDLTEWMPVPPGGDSNQFCKVTTDEYLTVRRIQNGATYLARRAATTGAPPDFRSQTHEVSTQLSNDKRIGGPRMTDYDVLLAISHEPVGHPFKAHLRSIRMGSFRDPNSEWAATTILQPTRKVTVEVVFPKWKPGKNLRFSRSDMVDGANYFLEPHLKSKLMRIQSNGPSYPQD